MNPLYVYARKKNCNVIILAGGQGKRMKTDKPKVLCEVLGIPMIDWVINACEAAELENKNICVVKGFGAEILEEHLGGKYKTVMQTERLGTGHAVMQAVDFLKENPDSDTLVLCGDAPFIDEYAITNALEQHIEQNNAVTIVSTVVENPTGYGRIVRGKNGISAIVEQKDASAEQLEIREVNSGCYWFKTRELLDVLCDIKPNNAQGEYYLTDCISLLIEKGEFVDAYISEDSIVALGANDRKGLLKLNELARNRIIDHHLDNGVEFTCTDGVIISPEVEIEGGATILSGVILKGKTKIGKNSVIGPNCIIEDTIVGENTVLNNVQAYSSEVGNNVKIGPFVQLRPNSKILDGVKIGDFVEIKNSTIGECTSVSHLTYVGDSDVGANVNFGCGVATANYDGENKFRTTVGDHAFIGCNTNLVAPVRVGVGAYTAAGSTITKDVPDGALAIERGETTIKEEYAVKKLSARTKKFENR